MRGKAPGCGGHARETRLDAGNRVRAFLCGSVARHVRHSGLDKSLMLVGYLRNWSAIFERMARG